MLAKLVLSRPINNGRQRQTRSPGLTLDKMILAEAARGNF